MRESFPKLSLILKVFLDIQSNWQNLSCILQTIYHLQQETYFCSYVSTLGDTGFFRLQGIKVLWRLQFLGYLRTLSLKFQKARTKIEVVLTLPGWLSQFSCRLHNTLIPWSLKNPVSPNEGAHIELRVCSPRDL